jgi:hypothetical protein
MDELQATVGLTLEKIEGLAVTAQGTALVVNDNDGVDDSNGETQLLRLKDIFYEEARRKTFMNSNRSCNTAWSVKVQAAVVSWRLAPPGMHKRVVRERPCPVLTARPGSKPMR